jgi:hypothetical protein
MSCVGLFLIDRWPFDTQLKMNGFRYPHEILIEQDLTKKNITLKYYYNFS